MKLPRRLERAEARLGADEVPPTSAVRRLELHEAQAQIVSEAQRWNVLQCGRRFGKTSLGVDLAEEPALEGLPVGWFAPTYKILDDAWRAVRDGLYPVLAHTDKQQRRLALTTGGAIEFWSLDHPDPGRGRKYARVIVDEAGIVRDLETIWTQAIRPTLTDLKGDAWFLGTPKGKNYFHSLYLRGQQGSTGWASWRFATVANPYLDPEEIAEAEQGMPELAFRHEYLGEAVEDGSNPFGESFIRACVAPLSPKAPRAWGWDLAKSEDWTVGIALDEDGAVCRFERWRASWNDTVERIRTLARGIPAFVDSTGVGDPILEQLQREAGHKFEGYKFSANSRQQLLEGLALAIQRGTVRFPEGTPAAPRALLSELESFGYEYTQVGVKYVAPAGLHDDCVMALALAVAKRSTARPVLIGSVTIGGANPGQGLRRGLAA